MDFYRLGTDRPALAADQARAKVHHARHISRSPVLLIKDAQFKYPVPEMPRGTCSLCADSSAGPGLPCLCLSLGCICTNGEISTAMSSMGVVFVLIVRDTDRSV